MKKPTILVAPLNWGLGHATRCIPIIHQLIDQQADVIIASDGAALTLLRRVFPDLPSVELESYSVSYHRKGSFIWNMFRQLPSILRSIRKEHAQLNHLVKTMDVDAVISDNRFGLWHQHIPTVFITHQLFTTLQGGWQLMRPFLNRINHLRIKRFDEVWVPDERGSKNLTGALSHQRAPQLKIHFVGWLSHFSSMKHQPTSGKKYDMAVVLSGPEPQRTILEETIIPQLEAMKLKSILVRGLPDNPGDKKSPTIEITDYMTAHELYHVIMNSAIIVCRSGYTSLMDLACLQKKAILIPTPGQTEQEYLADYFEKQHYCPKACQHQLNLAQETERVTHYSGIPAPADSMLLQQRIAELIKRAAR